MHDWEALYQARTTGWDRGEASPALNKWLEQGMFAQDASILVPGCGRGYEVLELAKRGFDVTALDLAPSAIASLNTSLQAEKVAATTVCIDIFDYRPISSFDVIYEQTCLCAIEPTQRELYEQCLSQWLKPNGLLLFSMMQTGALAGPPFHCDLLEMRTLFDTTRWQWLDDAPFVITRELQSQRFELGFVLKRI